MTTKVVLNAIKKGEFCAVRRHHNAAFIGGLSSEYRTFEIVQAAKTNRLHVVTQAKSANGSLLHADWEYCYSIGEWQEEAGRLFGNGEATFDSLSEIKTALMKTREQLTDEAVCREEARTERALGL